MNKKIYVPQLNPNDLEVELSQWHKKNGATVKKGELLCDFTTSKAVYQHECSQDGYLVQAAPRGSRMKAGDLLGLICASEKDALHAEIVPSNETDSKATAPVFSKAALERLHELGLQESEFSGYDFVTEKIVTNRGGAKGSSSLSLAKETEIRSLEGAYSSALRSSLSIQIEAASFLKKVDFRRISREAYTAYCVAMALKKHPRFLLSFGEQEPSPPLNIGYAIDLGAGVRLLEARNADEWVAEKWAEKIADWSLRLMRNEIKVDELGSGRFTITDLSSLGVLFFEPLLAEGQSAILGVGGDFEAQNPTLTLTLAFDHRVHDGRSGAAFLRDIKTEINSSF